METLNGKQKSPDVTRIELYLDRIDTAIEGGETMESAITELNGVETTELINAVRFWLVKSVDNKIYHKRAQLKKREFEKIAKKMLAADEVAAIERKVNSMTDAELLGGGNDD